VRTPTGLRPEDVSFWRQVAAVRAHLPPVQNLAQVIEDRNLSLLAVLGFAGEHDEVIVLHLGELQGSQLSGATARLQHRREEVSDIGTGRLEDPLASPGSTRRVRALLFFTPIRVAPCGDLNGV
jgi:hypothetical protein